MARKLTGSNLEELARNAVDMYSDAKKACKAILRWAEQNPNEWNTILEESIYSLCYLYVGQIRSKVNKENRKGQMTVSKLDRSAILSEAKMTDITGLLANTVGNQRMADCTKDYLLEYAEKAKDRGIGNLIQCEYYSLIASKLKGDQTVSSKYSNEDLDKLMKLATKSVKGVRKAS